MILIYNLTLLIRIFFVMLDMATTNGGGWSHNGWNHKINYK